MACGAEKLLISGHVYDASVIHHLCFIYADLCKRNVRWHSDLLTKHLLPFLEIVVVDAAVGDRHTVLLQSDGEVAAVGDNTHGQCTVPALPSLHVRYVKVAAGSSHTVLVRSDGIVEAFGENDLGQCWIPPLPTGMIYTEAAAGCKHTLLLRSDGFVVACGAEAQCHGGFQWSRWDQCHVRFLRCPPPLHYIGVRVGTFTSVLLRSDGAALDLEELDEEGLLLNPEEPMLPLPRSGWHYVSASPGHNHTVLIRNDGKAEAFGHPNWENEWTIPQLPAGLSYTAASAGSFHTMLLRSDGQVIAFGRDFEHNLPYPPTLPPGMKYIRIASRGSHYVLLRSDYQVLILGADVGDGICCVPYSISRLALAPAGSLDGDTRPLKRIRH